LGHSQMKGLKDGDPEGGGIGKEKRGNVTSEGRGPEQPGWGKKKLFRQTFTLNSIDPGEPGGTLERQGGGKKVKKEVQRPDEGKDIILQERSVKRLRIKRLTREGTVT